MHNVCCFVASSSKNLIRFSLPRGSICTMHGPRTLRTKMSVVVYLFSDPALPANDILPVARVAEHQIERSSSSKLNIWFSMPLFLDNYFIYRYLQYGGWWGEVGVWLWFCWLDVGLQLGCIGAGLMWLHWGLEEYSRGIVSFFLWQCGH